MEYTAPGGSRSFTHRVHGAAPASHALWTKVKIFPSAQWLLQDHRAGDRARLEKRYLSFSSSVHCGAQQPRIICPILGPIHLPIQVLVICRNSRARPVGSLVAADDRLVLFQMFVLVLITFLSGTLVTRLETSGQAIPDYLRFTPVTWPTPIITQLKQVIRMQPVDTFRHNQKGFRHLLGLQSGHWHLPVSCLFFNRNWLLTSSTQSWS